MHKPLLCLTFILACGLLPADILQNLGLDSQTAQEETSYTCVPLPPAAPPAQHSSAEGLPPLPLPVVPLRRTEKKNPPRPPVLIAKISTQSQADWATNPGDADNLLKWMAANLKVNFSTINLPEANIPADPQSVPLLYRTGHDAFTFPPEIKSRLREYLLRGGTLILESCCGRAAFARAALTEIQELIPERPPYLLSTDHPLFHSYFDISQIKFRKFAKQAGAKDNRPDIIGIDIGCRTAVFLFRWDVSCGWDNQPDSDRHHCLGYDIDTAKRLGANLMAYITAERSAAIPLSQALDFTDASLTKSGKFAIAIAKYHGQWKCRDAGLSMLLNSFHEQTKTPVRFAREEIALDSPRLFEVPFVYLTGHQDFTLTPAERSNLRNYLLRGGVLFAESCCGRESFTNAFRREIALVLDGATLERLPQGHQIFTFPNALPQVLPRPALAEKLSATGKVAPELLGIRLQGHQAVIFSPNGLACGWEMAECPYCHGLQTRDAIALGVNVLTYSLLQ